MSDLRLDWEGAAFDELVAKLRGRMDPTHRYELRCALTKRGLSIWALDMGADKTVTLAHSGA